MEKDQTLKIANMPWIPNHKLTLVAVLAAPRCCASSERSFALAEPSSPWADQFVDRRSFVTLLGIVSSAMLETSGHSGYLNHSLRPVVLVFIHVVCS